MDDGAAHDLQQPYINRALEHRAQLRWLYYLSLGLLWFLRKPAFSRVFVSNSAIRVESLGETVEIPFFQVEGVAFTFIPFLGGWFTLKIRDGKKHRFSCFLERTDYVLDALAIAQPTLVSSATIARYRRAAIVVDHVFARMEASFGNGRVLILMQILLPLVVTMALSVALGVRDAFPALLIFASVGLLNGIVTIVIWTLSELLEMFRKDAELLENPLNPLRDMGRERTARKVARVIHIFAVSLLAIWMWL